MSKTLRIAWNGLPIMRSVRIVSRVVEGKTGLETLGKQGGGDAVTVVLSFQFPEAGQRRPVELGAQFAIPSGE